MRIGASWARTSLPPRLSAATVAAEFLRSDLPISVLAAGYVNLMRSVPLLLVIFWFYFLVPYIGQWITGASRPVQVGAFSIIFWFNVPLGLAAATMAHRSLKGDALHRLDEIGNQVGPPLVLVLHIRPLRLRAFVIGRDVVDATARKQQSGEHGEKRDAGAAWNA
jgi:hypothetical protein